MIKFDDIIGYEKEKRELKMLCDVLKNPSKYKKLNVETPRALMIFGEPGLGKSLMAQALIEESGLPVFSCKKDRADGEFVNAIRETFEKAEKSAPSIVFLDDMDKFAQDNLSSDSNKEEFAVIQSCLEDVKGKGVFVIATVNNVHNLPDSLVRTGRFGRQIEVKIPSREDSKKIIEYYLKNKNMAGDVSMQSIAYILDGCTCATLAEAINEAGLIATFCGSAKIKKEHFISAIMRTVLKVQQGEQTYEEGKKYVAYHEAGHAVVALACGAQVGYITIKPHGSSGGRCMVFSDKYFGFEEHVHEAMCCLAGRAAIDLIFNEKDVGTKSDLIKAMSSVRSLTEANGAFGLDYLYDFGMYHEKQDFNQVAITTQKTIGVLKELYEKVITILLEKKHLLTALANALIEKEILIYDDVVEIVKNES